MSTVSMRIDEKLLSAAREAAKAELRTVPREDSTPLVPLGDAA